MIEVSKYKYEECGELKASFGYGSKDDGKAYQLDLCESCFKTALYALRDQRRAEFMFDETKNLSDVKINENISDDESLQDSIDEYVNTKSISVVNMH